MASLCLQNKTPNPSIFLKALYDLILISFASLSIVVVYTDHPLLAN